MPFRFNPCPLKPQAGNAGQGLGKLIETYRAIDTGTEIKLLMGNGSMLNDITLDKSSWSIKTKSDTQTSSSTTVRPRQIQKLFTRSSKLNIF
jgi:hypothetical protein